MEMIIHLDSDIFDLVNNGTKTIEGRVNDEKRRKLSIGDRLIFVNREDDNNIIESIVEDLIYFDNFEEMETINLPQILKKAIISRGREFSDKNKKIIEELDEIL